MSITPTVCKISFAKEASFRDGGGSGAALSTVYAFDLTGQYTETVELPEPLKQIVEKFLPSSRNLGLVVETGYEAGESTWSFELMTAIFLYYCLGACATTGAEAPYTHTITESDTLPSFAIHYEQELSGDPIRIDLLGCIVKAIELTIETGSETPIMASVELMCAKAIAGSNIAEPTALQVNKFVRNDVDTLTLTYNGAGIDTNMKVADKHTIRIENEVDFKPYMGDEYPNRVVIGKRTYSVKYTMPIRTSKWRSIMNLKVPNFAAQYSTGSYLLTAIAAQTRLERGRPNDNDAIDLAFSKLYLVPNREVTKLPSWEDKELIAEIEAKAAPGNAITFVATDALSNLYYEGS